MLLLVWTVLGAVATAPPPDVLPDGWRPVPHELVIEDSPHFARHDFHAAPTRGFAGSTRIAPGVPFSFSSKYGTRVYALPRGAAFPERLGDDLSIALASGDIPVTERGSVPVTAPTQGVLTHLRIAEISDGVIRLEVVAWRIDRDPRLIGIVGAGAALGLAGLALLVRRRRRRAAEG